MASVFTNVGEFRRGKGNRKTRLGPRTQVDTTTKRGEKQVQTPDDIALKRLLRLLDKPGLSQRDRYKYLGLMKQAEQIRFMNMAVLAEVLLYMHNVGDVITEENFNYRALSPYIERLLPHKEIGEGGVRGKDIPAEDLQIMRLRMAATFLRYVRYVSLLRETTELELEQALATQGAMGPIIEEEF
jgi:hypothetical protein